EDRSRLAQTHEAPGSTAAGPAKQTPAQRYHATESRSAFEELFKPLPLADSEHLDIDPTLASSQETAQGNDQNIHQLMPLAAINSRIDHTFQTNQRAATRGQGHDSPP